MPVRTQKEAAALVLSVRADTAQAKKDVESLLNFAVAANKRLGAEFGLSARQQIGLDRERTRSAQSTAREIARLEKLQADAAKAKTNALVAEWRREKLIRDEQERAARKQAVSGFGAQFRSAISSSRITLPGTGGVALPLVNRLATPGGAVAGVLAAAGGGLAAGFPAAIKQAADLEAALNLLQVRARATGGDIDRLREKARELGADLSLPATSSVDAANAMAALSSRGQSVQESMEGARGALQLAAVAGTDAAEAASFAADMVNVFKLSASETTRVADALAKTLNLTGANADELRVAFAQSSSVYAAAGFSLEKLAQDMIAMYHAGIRGSDAGTSLRTQLLRLISSAPEVEKALKSIGISVFDSAGRMKGQEQIVKDLSAALSKLTEKSRAAALQKIFGPDAGRAARVIFGQTAQEVSKLASQYEKAAGAAETAAAKNRGLAGAQDALNSALESFAEKRGAPFLSFLTQSVQLAGNLANQLDRTLEGIDKLTGRKLAPLAAVLRTRNDMMTRDEAFLSGTPDSRRGIAEQDARLLMRMAASPDNYSADRVVSTVRRYLPGVTNVQDSDIRAAAVAAHELALALEKAARAQLADESERARFRARSARENRPPPPSGTQTLPPPDNGAARRKAERERVTTARIQAQIGRMGAEAQAKTRAENYNDLVDRIAGATNATMIDPLEAAARAAIEQERLAHMHAAKKAGEKARIAPPGSSPAHIKALAELAKLTEAAQREEGNRRAKERLDKLNEAIDKATLRLREDDQKDQEEIRKKHQEERELQQTIVEIEQERVARNSQALQDFLTLEQERIEIQRQRLQSEEATLEDVGRVERLEKLAALLLQEHVSRIKSLLETRDQAMRNATKEGDDLYRRLISQGADPAFAARKREEFLREGAAGAMGTYNQQAANEYGRFENAARDLGQQGIVSRIAQELRDDVNTPWDSDTEEKAKAFGEGAARVMAPALRDLLMGRYHDNQAGGALKGALMEGLSGGIEGELERVMKRQMINPLSKAFKDWAASTELSGKQIVDAAGTLYAASLLFGAQGHKKQTGAMIGAVAGTAIGAAFGNPVAGFQIGAALGGNLFRSESAPESGGQASRAVPGNVFHTYIDTVNGIGDVEQISRVMSQQFTDRMGAR